MKYNVLVLEGLDNSGKSSIGKELAKKIGFTFFKNESQRKHFGQEDRSWWKTEAEFFFQLVKKKLISNIVLDRHIPSEYAYSFAYHRKTDMDFIHESDLWMSKNGFAIVYCHKQDYEKYEDDLIRKEYYKKILSGYDHYFSFSKIPVLKLDTTSENLGKQIKDIRRFVR